MITRRWKPGQKAISKKLARFDTRMLDAKLNLIG